MYFRKSLNHCRASANWYEFKFRDNFVWLSVEQYARMIKCSRSSKKITTTIFSWMRWQKTFVVSFVCAKKSNNDVAFATWLLRLIMSHIIARTSSTRKCDNFEISWFNLKKKQKQRSDGSISLKLRIKNCLIFSKQSVSELRMSFSRKQLTSRSKLQRHWNERKLKRKMKLTSLRQLKMNMKRNYLWIA